VRSANPNKIELASEYERMEASFSESFTMI